MSSDGSPTTLHRIGEVATSTGLTIRTLHYYEEIGLLGPTRRSDAGHRLYGPADLERLYQIAFLRQLGVPLDGIRASVAATEPNLGATMRNHLAAVEDRLAAENRLRSKLVRMVDAVESDEAATGDLLSVLEDMAMLETTLNRRISMLVYDDIEAAFDYLTEVFGFGPGEITREPGGTPVHAELQAGDGEVWLHPPSPDFDLASPKTLNGSSASMAVMVENVDAHHRFAVEHGATIRYEPVDQPYGYREYSATDLEGHLWSFMKPLD